MKLVLGFIRENFDPCRRKISSKQGVTQKLLLKIYVHPFVNGDFLSVSLALIQKLHSCEIYSIWCNESHLKTIGALVEDTIEARTQITD